MRAMTNILAFFLATSALAQTDAHVFPFGPTSATPVEIHFNSTITNSGFEVTRNGSLIRVKMLDPQPILVLPIPFTDVVRVPGLLPPGEYRVEVRLGEDPAVYADTEFVVRNAAARPFEIHPFAVPTFGGDLRLRISGVSCATSDCADVTVRIDGTAVTPLQRSSDGAIWFTAPAHEEGLVDVTVQREDFIEVSTAALYYFDRPERSVFERILFPVLSSTAGALGSQWVSEGSISNPKPWFVENVNSIGPIIVCIAYPCGVRIDPGSFLQVGGGFPQGAVLQVPRPEAPQMAFALRIRDVSHEAEGFGTQIPVVREADLFHDEIMTLLDVPLDPRYRVKVRIYALAPLDPSFRSGQLTIRGTNPPRTTLLNYTLTGTGEPYYAEVDLPTGATGERVNVYIAPPLDATTWAFASVTNNATQQVTIVSPNQ